MSLWANLEKKERNYSDRELFKRYLKRLSPFKKNMFIVGMLVLVTTSISIIIPYIVSSCIDELNSSSPKLLIVMIASSGYFVFMGGTWLINYISQLEIGKFTPYYMVNLRMEIFNKLQEQDMSFFDKNQRGELNTRVTHDSSDFGNITYTIISILTDLVMSACIFGFLLFYDRTLALVALVGSIFVLLSIFSFRKLVRRTSRTYRKVVGEINSSIVESIEGIQVAKNYGQEAHVSDKFHNTSEKYRKAAHHRMLSFILIWPLMTLISSTTIVVVIYLWSYGYFTGVTAGSLYMVILYVQMLFYPIMRIGTVYAQLQGGFAAFERLLVILDAEPTVKQNEETMDVGELEGEIVFDQLDFSYIPDEWIFQKFSLHINKGEKIAIVGHTGAGKTSLISILARYYEFQGGTITIDGIDIRDMTLSSYRKNLGVVQQDVFLFSGTVEENIRYGRTDSTEEELWNAIRAVHAEELIEYLPNGLQTEVGERGKNLSAGQRQIISFARSLLTNPNILILDEATSSVDAYTEAVIQEGLEVLMEGRTSIVIAHRLSTVINADRIIVLDQGKIIEDGPHEVLLTQGGKYAQLYKQYYEHQSLEWDQLQVTVKSDASKLEAFGD